MSDWYRSEKPLTEEMTEWLEPWGSDFTMTPIQNDINLIESAGFVDTAILDRNAWFAECSRELVDHMRGLGYDTLVETVGEDTAENLISRAEMRAVISAQGQLRPGHIRGYRPT